MTATEHVILVDENDNPIGTAEKLYAHRNHLCHRAFSVFILRNQPHTEILLQQRAKDKYHSSLLWTNTCCSHPRPGEAILEAGQRRLKEEMGLDAKLHSVGSFHYIAHFSNGLAENEIDHVLLGYSNETTFSPNPSEVAAYRWISLPDLDQELKQHPEQFTPWFSQALHMVKKNLTVE
jgi:isopentenyl-diphosphate delta-isomerase type 1